MSGPSSGRSAGSGRRHSGPLDDLTRGSWGWNDRKTVWVPPQFAGVDVEVSILGPNPALNRPGWEANPCQVPVVESPARNKHVGTNRRGGKTNAMGAACSDRCVARAEDLIAGLDPHPSWTPDSFDAWFESVVGRPGFPERIQASRLLRRLEWPIPCIGGAPESSLLDLQRAELAKHFDKWQDELGAVWLDGDSVLAVLGLGIVWKFYSFERAAAKVGTGNVLLWITEGARCKPSIWEHVLPTLADRQGSLFTDSTPWGGRALDGYWGKCVIRAFASEAAVANTKPDPPEITEGFEWDPADNYAIPGLVDEMERDIALYGENSAYVLRTWKHSWDTPEGACWYFSRQRHIRAPDLREFDLWIAGYDHGFGEHPLCCLVAGLTRARPRKVHVFAALYGSGIWVTPPKQGAEFDVSRTVVGFLMRTMERIRADVPDARLQGYGAPERPESWKALNNQVSGMFWTAADYVSCGGIEDVGALLAGDRLTFSPDLPREVFRDIEGARWATDTSGKNQLPTFDKDSIDPHAGEALVYLVQPMSNVLDLASFRGRGFTR